MGQGTVWAPRLLAVCLCLLLSGVWVHGFDDMSEDAEVFAQDPAMQTDQQKYTPLETLEGYSIPTDMLPLTYARNPAPKAEIPHSLTKPSNLRARTATKQIAALSATEKAVEAEAASIHQAVTKLKRQQLEAEMDELKGDPALRQLFKNQEQIQGEIQDLVELMKGHKHNSASSPLGDSSITLDELSSKEKAKGHKASTKSKDKKGYDVEAGEIIQRGLAEVKDQKSAAETDLERFVSKDKVVEGETGVKGGGRDSKAREKERVPAQVSQTGYPNPYAYMMMSAMYNQMMMNQYAAAKAMMDQQQLHASVQPSHYQSVGGSPMQPIAGEDYTAVGPGMSTGFGEYAEGPGSASYDDYDGSPKYAYSGYGAMGEMLSNMGENAASEETGEIPGVVDTLGLDQMGQPNSEGEASTENMAEDSPMGGLARSQQVKQLSENPAGSTATSGSASPRLGSSDNPADELSLPQVRGLEDTSGAEQALYDSKAENPNTSQQAQQKESKQVVNGSEGIAATKDEEAKPGDAIKIPPGSQSAASAPEKARGAEHVTVPAPTVAVAENGAPGGGLPSALSTGQAIAAAQATEAPQMAEGSSGASLSSPRPQSAPTVIAPPPGAIRQATVYTPADQVLPKPKAASLVARSDDLDVPVGGDASTLGEMQHWSAAPEMYEPAAPLTAPSTDVPDTYDTQGIKLNSITRRRLLRSLRFKKMKMLNLRRKLMSDMRLKMLRKLSEKK